MIAKKTSPPWPRLMGASLALACYAAPAVAQDAAAWGGLYAGANAGYGASSVCWNVRGTVTSPQPPQKEGCQNPDGAVVGAQVGYNWTLGHDWVLGVEAQADWTDMHDSGPSAVFPSDLHDQIDGFGVLSARLGYVRGSALFYGKVGAAFVRDAYRFVNRLAPSINGESEETRRGAALGAGIEVAFTPTISAGLEYDHFFLGNKDRVFSFVPAISDRPVGRLEQDMDLVTTRINVHF